MDILDLTSDDDEAVYSVVAIPSSTKNMSLLFTNQVVKETEMSTNQSSYVLLTVPNNNMSDIPESQIDISDLQIVTLADGTQAFVTLELADTYNEMSTDSEMPEEVELKFEDENSDGLEFTDIKDHLDVNEVSNESMALSSDLTPKFQVQLEDGSTALLDVDLFSLINTGVINTNEVENVNEEPKKKSFPCSYDGCEKVYTSIHHLRVHSRNHAGAKPYICSMDGCTKSFSTGYSLKTHIRTHTGEKPYACGYCDKCFKTSGDLNKHNRTHTGEKPFMCPVPGCGKCFTTTNIRKIHIRSHTGERPYNCSECGKGFASATNYKNHIRIHTGEKPYICAQKDCGKRFTEYSSLYKHQMVHDVKGFVCEICNISFRNFYLLENHRRNKHGLIGHSENIIVSRNGQQFIVKVNPSIGSYSDNVDDPDPLVISDIPKIILK